MDHECGEGEGAGHAAGEGCEMDGSVRADIDAGPLGMPEAAHMPVQHGFAETFGVARDPRARQA